MIKCGDLCRYDQSEVVEDKQEQVWTESGGRVRGWSCWHRRAQENQVRLEL